MPFPMVVRQVEVGMEVDHGDEDIMDMGMDEGTTVDLGLDSFDEWSG